MSPTVTEVDCRGTLCPMPVIKLAAAVQEAEAGTLVRLHTDDPAARVDIPAWCRMRAHELISQSDHAESDASTFEVRIAATPSTRR
ncbi:MAG TPA: sulfurtransferase TusA family protein [Nocardioidaceae bacterium]|nr:sulfurtransferase TusA family protein [Nocardioidaceae bacterium]